MATVFCENINRKIDVPKGANLREALLAEGVQLYRWPYQYPPLNCGFLGCLGGCAIEVLQGGENLSSPTGRERAKLKHRIGPRRLSCQSVVQGDVTIRIRP